MPKSKRLKVVLLIGIAAFLFVFVLLPVLGHAWRKRHPVTFQSVVPANQWKFFASEEGKFRVLFPGTPVTTNEISNSQGYEIIFHSNYVWADRQTQYAVNFSDNPEIVERLTPKQQFDASQKAVAESFGAIVSQNDFKLGTYPARDFEFVAGGKANFSGRIRLVLVNRRLYQIMVIFLTQNPHVDDFQNFLNSFSVQQG
jgi:hypothetical protein